MVELKEKRVLSLGFGYGFEITEIEKYGADVYGVEPKLELYSLFLSGNPEYKNKIANTTLQQIPDNIKGELFDVVFCSLWNIFLEERVDVLYKCREILKSDGSLVIGLRDDIYIYGDEYIESIPKLMRSCFPYVHAIKPQMNNVNKVFFIAKNQSMAFGG